MRYSGLMQAERSVTNFCSVVTNRRPVYKQIVFEIGETLQSGPSGSLEDLNHVDRNLSCGRVKDTPQNNDDRDNSAPALALSGPAVSTLRPSTPLSSAPPPISETHHTAKSILAVNSESQTKDTIESHTISVDTKSNKHSELLDEKVAVCDSSTSNQLKGTSKAAVGCQSSLDLGKTSESSPCSKLVSSSSTSDSVQSASSCLNVVEILKTTTSKLVDQVNSKKDHQERSFLEEHAKKADSSSAIEHVKPSGEKDKSEKAKAGASKLLSPASRRSRRLSSLEPQETTPSVDSTSTNTVLKPYKQLKEKKKIVFPASKPSQCSPTEKKKKEMVRLIHEDDTKIEVFCHKKGSRASKRLSSTDIASGVNTVIKPELPSPKQINSVTKSESRAPRETNSDVKVELPAPRETRLTRQRRSSCRSDRSESEISLDSHSVVDDPPPIVDMVDKTAKRGRPRSGEALLDEGSDSLVKCNGGTELLNGAYKLKNRRASRANSDETDNTTHCRTNGVHHSLSDKVDIKVIVSSIDKKKIENTKSKLRRRTSEQQHLSESESLENEKGETMKNKSKNDNDSKRNLEVCSENKDTKDESSHEQGSEKANARRRTVRIKGKKDRDVENESECSDDLENDKVPVRKKIGRPKGSFKNKKVIKVKGEENDGEDEDEEESKSNTNMKNKDKLDTERRGRPVGSRNRKMRYDLALLTEEDDDIFFGFPEEALKNQPSSICSKSNGTNVLRKSGRSLKELSPKCKEKDQKKRMSDAERFLRDNKEYYHFEETTDRLRSKSERSPGTKTDEEHEESDQSNSKEVSPKEKSRKSFKRMRIRKNRRGTQSSGGSDDDDEENGNKPTVEHVKSSIVKRRLSQISNKESDDPELYGKKFSEILDLKAIKEQKQAEERDLRTRKRLEERKNKKEAKEETDEEQQNKEESKAKGKGSEKDIEKNSLKEAEKIKSKEESEINENITEESSRGKSRVNKESKVIGSSDVDDKEDKKKVYIKDFKFTKEKKIQLKSQYQECDMFGNEVAELYFSFESVPEQESWYQTYQRFIDGIAENEFVYEDDPLRFVLPYEMPKEYIREQINAIRKSMMSKKKLELAELARKSPRCHASTLSILSDIIIPPARKSSRSIKSEYSSNNIPIPESTTTTTTSTTAAITTSKGGSSMELAASTFSTSSCASPSPSTSTHTSGSAGASMECSTGGMSDLSCDIDMLAQHMEQVMQDTIGDIPPPPLPENTLIQKITGESNQLLDDSPDLKKTPPKKRGKKKRIAKREGEYSKLCDSFLASDVDQAFLESLREESKESLQLCPDNILNCDSSTVIEDFYKCDCTDRVSCDDFSSADEGTEVSSVASFCDSETIDGSITSETKRTRVSNKRRKNLTGWPKVKKKKKNVVLSHTDTDDNESAHGCVDNLEPKKKRKIMHKRYNLLEPMSPEDLESLDADRRASPRKRNSVYYMDSWQFRYRTCK